LEGESILEKARPYSFFVDLLGFTSTSLYITFKNFQKGEIVIVGKLQFSLVGALTYQFEVLA